MSSIYLNNAATTYPKPEAVYLAMDSFNRRMGGNPGRGSNQPALQAGSVILAAREALAGLFNSKDCLNIAFTANVTESLNIGLQGCLRPGDHVITTSMEHNAVARPLLALSRQGVEWTRVNCAGDGSIDPEDIRRALQANTRMICTLHASNLTGTIMPIREIGAIARAAGVIYMIDAAQTAGVLPIDVEADNIDILTFTGHKGLYGSQGTGGIYIAPGIKIKPLKLGGTGSQSEHLEQPDFMPDKLESGTLNTPGIAALGAGVAFINKQGRDNIYRHEQKLLAQLIDGMRQIKGVKMYGPLDPRRQTAALAFNIAGMECGELSSRLDFEYGIISRSGIHCAPLAHQTVGSMSSGSCRLSPGYFNSSADITAALQAIEAIAGDID